MKKCIWIIVANRKILRDFFDRLLPPSMKELNTCKTSPIKIYTVRTAKKKNEIQNTQKDLQAPHVIAIYAVFKKLSQKRSYKMKHFVFRTLKTANFRISVLQNSGVGQMSPSIA